MLRWAPDFLTCACLCCMLLGQVFCCCNPLQAVLTLDSYQNAMLCTERGPCNSKHLTSSQVFSSHFGNMSRSRTSVLRVVYMCCTASTPAPGLAMEHRLAILRLLAISIPALEDKTLCVFASMKAEQAVSAWELRVSSIRWTTTKANRWYMFPHLLRFLSLYRRTHLASSLVACSWSCQRLVSDGHSSHKNDLDGLFLGSYQVWLLNWGCFDWHMPGQRTQNLLMIFWLQEE